MRRVSATEVMIEHNSKLARDPAHLRRLVAFWPEENIVHQLAKNALAYMKRESVLAGWKMVPVEPTEDMVIRGFESAPDEVLSDADVWQAFDAMSGCQQAAHKAKLCWAAMIEAVPEVGE